MTTYLEALRPDLDRRTLADLPEADPETRRRVEEALAIFDSVLAPVEEAIAEWPDYSQEGPPHD